MKIALLGYGVEGRSAYQYYSRKFPDAGFEIYDNAPIAKYEIPEDVKFIGGVNDFHGIKADIVVRTPAIAPSIVSSLGKITSVTKEFFDVCQTPIIGVTGTKGKGTTCSLIAKILEAAGKKVWLVGNIGAPALDILGRANPEDIIVYELSSFQLWDIDKSPHVAVVLMIEPEHLDIHKNVDEYIEAKSNIGKCQSKKDIIIFYNHNANSRRVVVNSLALKIAYPDSKSAHVKDEHFWYGDQKLCPVEALKLPGVHNQENACAAIAAAWHWVQGGETIAKGLNSFEGLPHRLKFVREVEDVSYYDDSISTTPSSTIAALHTFSQPKILIMGGSSKGADFAELIQAIKKSHLRRVLLIGLEALHIARDFDKAKFDNYEVMENTDMKQIILRAQQLSGPGDVVILSPACASFDMFKNYAERGDQFIKAVQAL